TVVGARRATLLVHDAEHRILRIVAALGVDLQDVEPVEVDDPSSVAARVFHEMRIISYDPTDSQAASPGCSEGRNYRGQAFLSVPVLYAAPGARGKPIGVINLTDRLGQDAFTAGDRKLVAAIANQIGAAIENARLVARDLGQQRVLRELELARDLQLKLLPSPLVVASRVDVAARCRQAESVGGDFYNLLNLRADRIGVMIGDVTSHGLGARGGACVPRGGRRGSSTVRSPAGIPAGLGGDGRGKGFGGERVPAHVARLKAGPAGESLESVHADLAASPGGAPPADDRTVV